MKESQFITSWNSVTTFRNLFPLLQDKILSKAGLALFMMDYG